MAIFRGLNIAKGMIDVDDPRIALRNLGLNRADLDLIRGLTQPGTDVTVTDFHAVSKLIEPQKTTLQSLASTAETTNDVLESVSDIRVPMDFNMSINSRIAGSAIKFNYIDFSEVDGLNYWSLKASDISTSRQSSWSPVGNEPTPSDYILYGGEAKVIGDTIAFTNLETTVAPIPKTFRAEVATHVLKINNTNAADATNTHQFLAMKGIPITWNAYFRDVDLGAVITPGGVSDSLGLVPITWRITNTDGSDLSYNSGDGTTANPGNIGIGTETNPAIYAYRDTSSKPRRLEFFYDPSKVQRLDVENTNLIDWTNISLPALKILNIEGNDFSIMPEFRSDATVAKSGYAGGAGLATALEEISITGNNLGLTRAAQYIEGTNGFTESSALSASTASAQLNRLPTTMTTIFANGCFRDATPVNLKDYKALRDLSMGATYQRDLVRAMLGSKISPQTYDPLEANTGLRSVTDLWPVSGSVTTISLATLPSGYVDIWFDGGTSSLSSTKIYVKYNQRVDLYPRLGAGVTGLTDGEVYIFEKIGDGSSNIVNVLNKEDTAAVTMSTSGSSVGGHSFVKCDVDGNLEYYGTDGISYYSTYRQPFSGLSPGVYRSPNTTYVDIRQNGTFTNSEYPNYDGTNTATKVKSSTDMAIPAFRSSNITEFQSEYGYHNVIDMSNKINLKRYSQKHNSTDSRWQTAERTIDGKFDGCTSLEYFNLYNPRNMRGNFKTNGMFQGKANLYFIDIRWGYGVRGTIQDDIFLGSNNLTHYLNAGSDKELYGNDIFSTSGAVNHRGQAFANSQRLQYLYSYQHWRSSGTIVHPTNADYNLNLTNCKNLKQIYLAANDLRGTLPDFAANQKLEYLDLRENARLKDLIWVQAEQTYTIISLYGDATTNTASKLQWEQIGWVDGGTDPITGVNHGANPTVGDSFVAQAINPKTVQLDASKRYMIRKVGTHTESEWHAIMNGSPSIYPGRTFTANAAAVIGGSNSGAEVMPYAKDRILSRGLTGTFPILTHPKLKTIKMNVNSFSGQFPAQELPKLQTLWLNDNEFSELIPDFSNTPSLKNLRMQNNKLNGYSAGSLRYCLVMRDLDFSNNNLRASTATELIYDLYENYQARPRGGVTLNFLGQSRSDGLDTLSQAAVDDDDTDGIASSSNKLAALRSNGWTILLD